MCAEKIEERKLERIIAKPKKAKTDPRAVFGMENRFVCHMAGRISTIGLGKPPESPEPIVTPRPPIYRQWAAPLGSVPMRPMRVEGTQREMTPAETAKVRADYQEKHDQWKADGCPKGKEPTNPETVDKWMASACQSTCVAMQLIWLLTHPTASKGLVVPNRG